MEETTIAAISTAMSASGIGIVRISGPEAFEIASRVYRSKGGKKSLKDVPSHTIHYGYIYDSEEMVDEVLVMAMRAPRTYTGEDTIEIDCHGGVYAIQRVLEALIKNCAAPAEPGEFTGHCAEKRSHYCRTGRIYQACIPQWKDRSFPGRSRYGRDTVQK